MKILNFGSLNIDYTYSVDHFVCCGETLDSERLDIFPGGKGLNQSIAMGKSGAAVWQAGAIGTGDGDFLVDELKAAGVQTDYVCTMEGKSGHAIIQKDKEGSNCILLYGGSNSKITKEFVDKVLNDFDEGDYLVLQNEISEIPYILEIAHKKRMTIFMNPSPVNAALLKYPLEYVDYLLLNEIEANYLCGEETHKEENDLIKDLGAKFLKTKVVLTLGSKGAVYIEGSRVLKQKAYKVSVKDTTAAGDTFTGFFIGSIAEGAGVEKALDRAAKAASICVSRMGAAPSIPTGDEVDQFSTNL